MTLHEVPVSFNVMMLFVIPEHSDGNHLHVKPYVIRLYEINSLILQCRPEFEISSTVVRLVSHSVSSNDNNRSSS